MIARTERGRDKCKIDEYGSKREEGGRDRGAKKGTGGRGWGEHSCAWLGDVCCVSDPVRRSDRGILEWRRRGRRYNHGHTFCRFSLPDGEIL